MVYGIDNIHMTKMKKTIEETFEGVTVSITKERRTPGGYGDLFISYSSGLKSTFGTDSGNFNLCSTPSNCGLIFMGGVNARFVKKKSLKFEILELMIKYFGHSGILLSQVNSGSRTELWKIYEQYGFSCILQDRAVIHGNNKDLRIYYKPLNTKNKVDRGGESWEIPLGFIETTDLKKHTQK